MHALDAKEFPARSPDAHAPDQGLSIERPQDTSRAVVNDWLPSIDRTYNLPGAVVDGVTNDLVVFPPEGLDSTPLTTPLAAACVLLGLPSG